MEKTVLLVSHTKKTILLQNVVKTIYCAEGIRVVVPKNNTDNVVKALLNNNFFYRLKEKGIHNQIIEVSNVFHYEEFNGIEIIDCVYDHEILTN